MTTPQPAALPELLREIVAYCREAGHDWSNLAEAEHMLAALQSQPAAAGVSDAEWWHEVLGSAGPDLLNLVKQWSDNKVHVYQFANEAEKIVKAAAQRALIALRPQAESEQEKERRRSLAEAQATISERNAEIIELQKRIRRSPQAVPMTEGEASGIPGMFKTTCPWCENGFTTSLPSLDPVSTRVRLLSSEELAACCGGCASNSAIETWMRRAIAKFCEVNSITAPAGGEGK